MATTAAHGITRTWSPARVYLVATGVFLIGAAVAGFGVSNSFPTSPEAAHSAETGHIYGIFETNGWHNLSTLVSGTISLAFALRPSWARTGAFVKGTLYATVTISIAVWGPETFLIASNTADQVVHGSLAVTAFAAAFATPRF
jgi:hypothetical protein